jgi:hypothetical protein
VSGAVDTLDPIEAARADIAGSKHLIAAVADDLSRHQEWLENYRVSEKRHARWLQFQELRYQTERKRQALVRALKRSALSVALLVRSIWLFCVRLVTAFVAWLTPRAHALALTLARWIARGAYLDLGNGCHAWPHLAGGSAWRPSPGSPQRAAASRSP